MWIVIKVHALVHLHLRKLLSLQKVLQLIKAYCHRVAVQRWNIAKLLALRIGLAHLLFLVSLILAPNLWTLNNRIFERVLWPVIYLSIMGLRDMSFIVCLVAGWVQESCRSSSIQAVDFITCLGVLSDRWRLFSKNVFYRNIDTARQWNFKFIMLKNDLISSSNVQPFVNFGERFRVHGVPIYKIGLRF